MLSRFHQTIFVHIPKTAGQSIEVAFLNSLGLNWQNRAPLLLRYNPDRNFGPERLAHMFAWEYYFFSYVSFYEFSQFFKFSIVRNPYDRAISEFNFRKNHNCTSISEYISNIKDDMYSDYWRHICPQHYFLMDKFKEKIIVDKLIKYEDLKSEWNSLSKKIFNINAPLPHINKSRNNLNFKSLSREDIEFINDKYQIDFKYFGYAMK
ncbi:sulfotransferase family 2 domain-containing protein [Acuticoccus mangrovi]|uniref:Sulfotransferase family 2 domain-containing protein n=1 Tax=Acuticoccus mangrovi TaxID=2796142 RepID=A0A934IHV1_9HYPH|nr:sulfotransferase family 2 domain-containing protein [Acuticoccus mangrovi]MBJ3776748.1 sulfotransferase family 2 domain-containing protein [Acuticoccus mangrovi]